MPKPVLFDEIDATRSWVREQQAAGRTVGLVPTMGALHQGHMSLALLANGQCDRVITTIFVNPTQFAPGEDLERYPRDLDRDCELLGRAGVDAVFAPEAAVMYPPGAATTIDVGPVAHPLEGASRPTHFAGVATVVAKLFQIAPADRAYFGRKDYQQTVVVRRMVADLNLPIEVVVCPIVREPDGLAMSSRNAYLSPAERKRALVLNRGLCLGQRLHQEGERDPATLRRAVSKEIGRVSGVDLEYVAVLDDGTMDEPTTLAGPAVLAVAARVGQTRLIDNVPLS